jgi:hypothetical protein
MTCEEQNKYKQFLQNELRKLDEQDNSSSRWQCISMITIGFWLMVTSISHGVILWIIAFKYNY